MEDKGEYRFIMIKVIMRPPCTRRHRCPKGGIWFCSVCVFITAVPITKLFAWGEGDCGGHVLRETTSRGLCGLVCPSHTSERGGDGNCVNEGGGEEGERERERAGGVRLRHSPGY